MDESAFLKAIAESPDVEQLLRSYARWLSDRGDKRGDYLQLELERRATEARLLDLEHKLQSWFNGMEPSWLDTVVPLKVVSPMVGTFYSSPNPTAAPYVKEGDFVTPTTIVGIIEALKIFNEIPAGVSGVVSEILVSTGDIVEYGKPMFHIRRPPQLRAGG